MKKLLIVIAAFLYTSFAATMPMFAGGKIVGKVVDSETKEALPGASVVVVGTTKGAVTNPDGDFFILNVDPGNYTLKASFVGYNETFQSNIRVSANLTTEVSFELKSISLTTGTVEIIATRPLIDRNITNQNSIIDQEALRNLPIRDVQAVVATQSGVVRQMGNLYVRGSRADATGMYVDGVKVNDPMLGGSNSSEISSAIEEIQFQAGGYTAEYGGSNAGIISTTSRVGGENYKFSFDLLTDNFVGKNSDRKFLGGYSYGYSNYEATASGPIGQYFRFLIAGKNEFTRTPDRYWQGLQMENVVDPKRITDTITINYPDGYRINNARNKYVVQGNITAEVKELALTFKLGGKYQYDQWRDGAGFGTMFDSYRIPINQRSVTTANFKTIGFLANNLFCELNLSYYGDFFVSMDPEIKHNILGYGDSVTNASYGYALAADGRDVQGYALYGQTFSKPGNQLAGYAKTKNKNYTIKADVLWQINKQNEVKTGFEYIYHTIRRYSFASAFDLRSFVTNQPDAAVAQWYERVDNYGYDIYGNQTDDEGIYAAKHPQFFGAYIQDKLEFSDLIINAGLRLDGIVTDSKEFNNPAKIDFDADGLIDQATMKDVPDLWKISPRLGFSFSLTDKAKFHAQYGKFVQQTRLRDIYQGLVLVSDNIKGGYAISAPVGFGLRPERTTQYDLGFSQELTDNVAIDLTGFYKDIKDQIQIRQQPNAPDATHGAYYYFANGDFSTTKGFELKIDVRRTERISASVNYTFSDAQGTGSTSASGFRAIWQSPRPTAYFPQNVSPLDFNQSHRGSVNLDYRFSGDDGPIWAQNSGINLLFQFNSGHNYTTVSGFGNSRVPLEQYNTSVTPWNFQLDLRLDKGFDFYGVRTNIYLLVLNVLDTKNITNVHMQTGSTNDGYLNTDEGKAIVASYVAYGQQYADNYVKLYDAFNNTNGITTIDGAGVDPYGTPRQIRLGFKIDY